MTEVLEIEVRRGGRTVGLARVPEWGSRHAPHSKELVERSVQDGHRLLFRGTKELRHKEWFFEIGNKAESLYLPEDSERHDPVWHARKFAEDVSKFQELAIEAQGAELFQQPAKK